MAMIGSSSSIRFALLMLTFEAEQFSFVVERQSMGTGQWSAELI